MDNDDNLSSASSKDNGDVPDVFVNSPEPEGNRARDEEAAECNVKSVSSCNDTTYCTADSINGDESADSSGSITIGGNDQFNSARSLLDSLDLDVPSSYEVEPGMSMYLNVK